MGMIFIPGPGGVGSGGNPNPVGSGWDPGLGSGWDPYGIPDPGGMLESGGRGLVPSPDPNPGGSDPTPGSG